MSKPDQSDDTVSKLLGADAEKIRLLRSIEEQARETNVLLNLIYTHMIQQVGR